MIESLVFHLQLFEITDKKWGSCYLMSLVEAVTAPCVDRITELFEQFRHSSLVALELTFYRQELGEAFTDNEATLQ